MITFSVCTCAEAHLLMVVPRTCLCLLMLPVTRLDMKCQAGPSQHKPRSSSSLEVEQLKQGNLKWSEEAGSPRPARQSRNHMFQPYGCWLSAQDHDLIHTTEWRVFQEPVEQFCFINFISSDSRFSHFYLLACALTLQIDFNTFQVSVGCLGSGLRSFSSNTLWVRVL